MSRRQKDRTGSPNLRVSWPSGQTIAVCCWCVTLCVSIASAADNELAKHQQDDQVLDKAFNMHVSHSGQYPPSFLRISTNPLRDEPNLSVGKVKQRQQPAIHGSRKAYVVTQLSYLKKEWCKTEPVKQEIRKKGCLKKTVINRFCYGQCNSFFIPRRRGKQVDDNAFKSCAFCRPKRTDFVRVTLNCPGRAVPRIRKKIQVIKSCSCMSLNLE